MTDDDFWMHVFATEGMDDYDDEGDNYDPNHEALDIDLRAHNGYQKCETCGAVGACGWDSEGLPLVHPVVRFGSLR